MTIRLADLQSRKRFIWRLAQIALTFISLLFLAIEINRSWATLRIETMDLDWSYAAQATVILIGAWTLITVPTYLALRRYAPSITYLQATIMFCASQLVKYLPGGLWALPGRMVLYQRRYNLRTGLTFYLVVLETLTLWVGAVIVGLVAWPAIPSYPWQITWLGIATAGAIATHMSGQPRLVCMWLTRCVPSLGKRLTSRVADYADMTSSTLWAMVFYAGTFWLAAGWGFHRLVIAVINPSITLGLLEAVGIYALAWAVGFMIVLVPAGIGIREGMLVVLLRPFIGDADALVVALLARLWWTLAEALWSIVALGLMRILKL